VLIHAPSLRACYWNGSPCEVFCRAAGVDLKWLLGALVTCFEALSDHLHVQPVTGHGNVMMRRLEVEGDAMASFAQKKANKQRIWIVMDGQTRRVITFHVGNRSRTSAKRLWSKIPDAYRQHASFYTDQYVVDAGVIPTVQHRATSKLARKTNHIERFNDTLRQRVSRLVREALSFSRKFINHIGAIKFKHFQRMILFCSKTTGTPIRSTYGGCYGACSYGHFGAWSADVSRRS